MITESFMKEQLTHSMVQVCNKYFNYVSMLMMGTFLIAESVEACGLHRRIALKILSVVGMSLSVCHCHVTVSMTL